MSTLILSAEGRTGTVNLFENSIIIKQRFGSVQRLLSTGDHEVYFDSIRSINYKSANSLTLGFFQIVTSQNQDKPAKSGILTAPKDKWTVSFTKSQQPQFDKLRSLFDTMRNSKVNNTTVTTSAADELAKFANLRDQGVITQAEFESKKANLLKL